MANGRKLKAEHEQMVEDCEARSEHLSEWELGFIDSLSRYLGSGGFLSDKQAEKLDGIWERITTKGARR